MRVAMEVEAVQGGQDHLYNMIAVLRLYRIPQGPPAPETNDSSQREPSSHSDSRQGSSSHPGSYQGSFSHSGSHPSSYPGRPAVLLQHGLLDSCAAFLLNGPQQSLAFILADAGTTCQLWSTLSKKPRTPHTPLPQVRPASYGRLHPKPRTPIFPLPPVYDLPAMVDFIQNTTDQAKIAFVGHSQGTTVLLVGLALNPALADVVTIAVMLAPVAFTKHMPSSSLTATVSPGDTT
eukprot:gene26943-4565_t